VSSIVLICLFEKEKLLLIENEAEVNFAKKEAPFYWSKKAQYLRNLVLCKSSKWL
jgi:hypothetical protein